MENATTTWGALSAPWQAAFDEAWASWCAGNFGIGAAAARGDDVVVRGRNRVLDPRSEPGVLADTFAAHAEMNVLALLSWGERDVAIYTTLEPCLMCTGALVMCRIEAVHHAADDALFSGIRSDLVARSPFVAERMPASHGPIGGPMEQFARLLPHVFSRRIFGATGTALDAATERQRADAEVVFTHGLLDQVRDDGGTTLDAVATVWELLGGPDV